MPKGTMTLHEAIQTVLAEQPDCAASAEFLSEEITRRGIYHRKAGGPAPPSQIRLRARKYPSLFELVGPETVRLAGGPSPLPPDITQNNGRFQEDRVELRSGFSANIDGSPTSSEVVGSEQRMSMHPDGESQMAESKEDTDIVSENVLVLAEESEAGDDEAPLDIAPERRRVKTDKRDVPVETLHNWVQRGKINLQPEFQREFVWNKRKASRLIESLLLEIPIPVIYVAQEPDDTMPVVDGQQRLTSVCAFIDSKFPDGETFKLNGLQVLTELNGKGFKELSAKQQEAVLGATLRLIVIEKDSDPDVKFEVFERLNLGAEKLNDQELRNSVYRGSYNSLLKELSGNAHMLKVLRSSRPHKRMADRQLILRFFAMWRATHLKFKSPTKQFMNREMEAYRNAGPSQIAEMREIFERSIEMAYTIFGTHAFRRYHPGSDEHDPDGQWERNKLNVALWDTLLYTFSFYEKRQIIPIADRVREEFLDLMTHDDRFVEYITATTDQVDRVRYRAEEWRRRLDTLVGNTKTEPRAFTLELKRELFDANPACQICRQQIHDLDDAEVDHVTHYWRGGQTIPENARLAHRYCNRVRGGR